MPSLLKTLAKLGRISNLPTVWTNVFAGLVMAGWLSHIRLDVLFGCLAGGSIIYWGGMALNDAADEKWDREHGKDRPIPAGDITARSVWALSLAALGIGAGVMIYWGKANPVLVGLLVLSVIVYDLYHKPWSGSVIVMAACRFFLVLAAASTSSYGSVWSNPRDILLPAFALACYIVGVTWLARSEGAAQRGASNTLRWPAILLLLVPAILFVWRDFGGGAAQAPLWLGLLLLLLFLFWTLRSVFAKGWPVPRRVGFLLAGIVLVDALAVRGAGPYLALLLVVTAPLLLLWQRWVAAT